MKKRFTLDESNVLLEVDEDAPDTWYNVTVDVPDDLYKRWSEITLAQLLIEDELYKLYLKAQEK